MKGKLQIYYDEDGDLLEINKGSFAEGSFKNLGKGIFERRDKKTNEVTGIVIHGFRKRVHEIHDVKLPVEVEFFS